MPFCSKRTIQFCMLVLACSAISQVSGKKKPTAPTKETTDPEALWDLIKGKDMYEIAKEALEHDDYVGLVRRGKELEKELAPIVKALPQSSSGYVELGFLRHILNRLFLKLHGWALKDLREAPKDDAEGVENLGEFVDKLSMPITMTAALGAETSLPTQDAIEKIAVAATFLEESLMEEVVDQFSDAFDMTFGDGEDEQSRISAKDGEDVLLLTMQNLIMIGNDECEHDGKMHRCPVDSDVEAYYPAWKRLTSYLKETWQLHGKRKQLRSNLVQPSTCKWGNGRHARKALKKLQKKHPKKLHFSYKDLLQKALNLRNDFKHFSSQVCKDMRSLLTELEGRCPGRVPIAAYYEAGSEFNQSVSYLRTLGALHDQAGHLSVLVPNVISSGSHCVRIGEHYVQCCVDQCEAAVTEIIEKLGTAEPSLSELSDVLDSDGWTRSMMSKAGLLPSTSPFEPVAKLVGSHPLVFKELAHNNNGKLPLRHPDIAHLLHSANPRVCRRPAEDATPDLLPEEYFDRMPPCTKQDEVCHETERGLLVSKAEKDRYLQDWAQMQENGEAEKCSSDGFSAVFRQEEKLQDSKTEKLRVATKATTAITATTAATATTATTATTPTTATTATTTTATTGNADDTEQEKVASRLLATKGEDEDAAGTYSNRIDMRMMLPLLEFLACSSLFVTALFVAFKVTKPSRRASVMTQNQQLLL